MTDKDMVEWHRFGTAGPLPISGPLPGGACHAHPWRKPCPRTHPAYPPDAPHGHSSPGKAKEALQRLLFPTNAEKIAACKPYRRHQTALSASRRARGTGRRAPEREEGADGKRRPTVRRRGAAGTDSPVSKRRSTVPWAAIAPMQTGPIGAAAAGGRRYQTAFLSGTPGQTGGLTRRRARAKAAERPGETASPKKSKGRGKRGR
jgi:hypothetical protein